MIDRTVEFEQIRQEMLRRDPEALDDWSRMRRQVAETDSMIAAYRADGSQDAKVGVVILAQGRNFLAWVMGQPLVDVPEEDDIGIVAEPVDTIVDRHVAIYTYGQEVVGRALEQVLALPVYLETLRYKVYVAMSDLLEACLTGQLCGIIGTHQSASVGHTVEGSLRHDLKYVPGWNYDAAQEVVLPPCADLNGCPRLTDIAAAIIKMQRGESVTNDAAEFDLNQAMQALMAHTVVPTEHLAVLVVDDQERELYGMFDVLQAWLGVRVFESIQEGDELPKIGDDTNILLLDEGMGSVSGTKVVKSLGDRTKTMTIASISSGAKPAWAQYHFAGKGSIGKSWDVALGFVHFMNGLIKAHEANRA